MENNSLNETKDIDKKVEKRREVVMHYRKPSVFSSLLLILIGACIATAVLGCIYLFDLKDNETQTNIAQDEQVDIEQNVEENVEIPEVNLDINGEFVQELYKKIPSTDAMPNCVVYSDERITQGHITDYDKMMYVLENMFWNKEYEVTTSEGMYDKLSLIGDTSYNREVDIFKVEDVEEKYRNYFGSDKEILKETIRYIGYVFDFNSEDNCFYGHAFEGGGGQPYIYSTKIDSAEKSEDGKEIYIYDYFMSVETYNNYDVYSFAGNYNVSIGNEPEEYKNHELIEKYIENGLYKFKNTFKLDDTGNYYWYSTEPIMEKN